MTALLAGVIGAIIAAGIVLFWISLTPPPEGVKKTRGKKRTLTLTPAVKTRLIVGITLGVVITVLTSMPVMLVAVPAAVVGLPALLGKQPTKQRDTILALESWARSLASAAASGNFTLRQVIGVTKGSVDAVLLPSVNRLHHRMSTNWTNTQALRAWADELDSAYSDEVAVYLIQAAEFDSQGLATALSGVAERLAAQAKIVTEILTEQEKPRSTLRSMTIIIGVVLVLLVMFSGTELLSAYRTVPGMIIVTLVLASFAGLLVWARSRARIVPPSRVLLTTEEGTI